MSQDLAAQLVAMHLGTLHPYEKVLTLLLAFGPFVVLAAVIAVRRRHEADDADDADDAGEADDAADTDEPVERAGRPAPDRPTAG